MSTEGNPVADIFWIVKAIHEDGSETRFDDRFCEFENAARFSDNAAMRDPSILETHISRTEVAGNDH